MALDQKIIDAVQNGDLTALKEYVESDKKIDDVDSTRKLNLLFYGRKHLPIVEYLLDHGMDPNNCGPGTATSPLMYAFSHEKELVTLLINRNAILNKGEQVDVEYMVEQYDEAEDAQKYIDLLFQKGFFTLESSILKDVIKNPVFYPEQCFNFFCYLIEERKANLDYRDNTENTLLHLAAEASKRDIINYLIAKKANGLALNQFAKRPIDSLLFGYHPSGVDTKETVKIRLGILKNFLDLYGQKLQKLGWFNDWIKNDSKKTLTQQFPHRAILAEEIDQYILGEAVSI